MMKKFVASSLVVLLGVSTSFAANNVGTYSGAWGGGSITVCREHALEGTAGCIGASMPDCKSKGLFTRDATDEYAIHMMVAMEVNDKGAKFCPVQVESKNEDKGNAWTEYLLMGNTSNCIWLCRAGYTGASCNQSVANTTTTTASLIELHRADFNGFTRQTSGKNIENDVAMFQRALGAPCGVHKSQEHDSILAITDWLPSGHGAKVRKMVVRAQREGWKPMISWPAVYPVTGAAEVLVCLNGYKPDASNNDCVAINPQVEKQAEAAKATSKMCDGWTGYDSAKHVYVQPDGENCYQFRCKQEGYAFASNVDRTCVECKTGARVGVRPDTGECMTCELGKIFSASAKSSGYCTEGTGLSKTDMMYGRGNSKNTFKDIAYQCWTMTETEKYRDCVFNIKDADIDR